LGSLVYARGIGPEAHEHEGENADAKRRTSRAVRSPSTAVPAAHLPTLALALGAEATAPLTPAESRLLRSTPPPSPTLLTRFRTAITQGHDPLGDAFLAARSPSDRRHLGATYTPPALVASMLAWAASRTQPTRIVDPGAGSGRFLVAAGRRFPDAELVGIEVDPLAALLLRAHLAAAGLASRATVLVRDYRRVRLPKAKGPTLFVGNPPYVRHHELSAKEKDWLAEAARKLGLQASKLAGLHAHFFLATALHAREGDVGCFVTSAEWLDVNYGRLVRKLLLGPLGGVALHRIDPKTAPFDDALTTAVVACFEVGARPEALRIKTHRSLRTLGSLDTGPCLPRASFEASERWSSLSAKKARRPSGFVELGELCRVHRGQVTGNNRVWIAGPHAEGLPSRLLFPTVTKARELFEAGDSLLDASTLRKVIDLPEDLDRLRAEEREAVLRFLRTARAMGADQGFIANYRRAWWSVGLREPAPILATYMARRPPAFVRNLAGARHINIAHGLYPRVPLTDAQLDALARHLTTHARQQDGRTYAGGLTKFEPKEMERLPVPNPDLLTRRFA